MRIRDLRPVAEKVPSAANRKSENPCRRYQVNVLLTDFSHALCAWLEGRLPALGAGWWNDNVVQRLTFQQQRSVQERRITSLGGLDLAALLRVLDQSWHELAAVGSLPKEARTWVTIVFTEAHIADIKACLESLELESDPPL